MAGGSAGEWKRLLSGCSTRAVLAEEKRLRVLAIKGFRLIRDLADLHRVELGTSLFEFVVRRSFRRVEVRFHVGNSHRRILVGWSCGPGGVTVAPVVQLQVTADRGHVLGHFVNEFAVDVKCNPIWCPVKAVFVKRLVGPEIEMLNVVGRTVGCIAIFCRFE